MIGEAWSVIAAKGPAFGNVDSPTVAVRAGAPGSQGVMEISDIMFSSIGPSTLFFTPPLRTITDEFPQPLVLSSSSGTSRRARKVAQECGMPTSGEYCSPLYYETA